MNSNMKKAIQAELYHQLKLAWVLCSLDVACGEGAAAYTMDVTVETRSFIFGRIAVQDALPDKDARSVLKRYGIEARVCSSMDEIPGCVKWAVRLQEKYVHCHAKRLVA